MATPDEEIAQLEEELKADEIARLEAELGPQAPSSAVTMPEAPPDLRTRVAGLGSLAPEMFGVRKQAPLSPEEQAKVDTEMNSLMKSGIETGADLAVYGGLGLATAPAGLVYGGLLAAGGGTLYNTAKKYFRDQPITMDDTAKDFVGNAALNTGVGLVGKGLVAGGKALSVPGSAIRNFLSGADEIATSNLDAKKNLIRAFNPKTSEIAPRAGQSFGESVEIANNEMKMFEGMGGPKGLLRNETKASFGEVEKRATEAVGRVGAEKGKLVAEISSSTAPVQVSFMDLPNVAQSLSAGKATVAEKLAVENLLKTELGDAFVAGKPQQMTFEQLDTLIQKYDDYANWNKAANSADEGITGEAAHAVVSDLRSLRDKFLNQLAPEVKLKFNMANRQYGAAMNIQKAAGYQNQLESAGKFDRTKFPGMEMMSFFRGDGASKVNPLTALNRAVGNTDPGMKFYQGVKEVTGDPFFRHAGIAAKGISDVGSGAVELAGKTLGSPAVRGMAMEVEPNEVYAEGAPPPQPVPIAAPQGAVPAAPPQQALPGMNSMSMGGQPPPGAIPGQPYMANPVPMPVPFPRGLPRDTDMIDEAWIHHFIEKTQGQEMGLQMLSKLTGAMQERSIIKAENAVEAMTQLFPQVFEQGVGVNGRLRSPGMQKSYIDQLWRKSTDEGLPKEFVVQQQSAFNDPSSMKVLPIPPPKGKPITSGPVILNRSPSQVTQAY